ncbi:MAG TPA: hypothetical protein VH413_19740, partial [Verrucomicrobiae bacterium]|nr:hypothetical protein [Verrucomicrobiae bacterium]
MKKCPRCGKEYSDATAVCPEHGKPLSDSKDEMAPYLWFAKTSRMSGLILMALIGFFAVTMNRGFNLGFYSLLIISGPMIGIIAIINGHLAQASAKKLREQDRKKTSPVLGLITGYIGTLLTGTALMFAIFHPIKSRPTAINCASNLKNIGLAMRIYAVDHGNMLPKNLMEITNELPNPNTLICP